MRPNDFMSARRLSASAEAADDRAIRRAFALVSLSHPHVSFKGWFRYLKRADRLEPTRAGVVSVEDARGYVHALFRYEVARETALVSAERPSESVLRLRDLVFADLPGVSLLAAIADKGEALARSMDCCGITIELPATAEAWSRTLNGFDQVSGGVVSKRLIAPRFSAAVDVGLSAQI